MENIEIREMQNSDIDGVLEVERLSFEDPWSREAFEGELSGLNPCVYFVAVYREPGGADEKLCGYMGMWHIIDEGHITNVAVHPDFRRAGVGSMLVEASLEAGRKNGIRAFTLEVRRGNTGAQELYRRFGFINAGVRKRYYSDGEDAFIMWTEEIE